VADIEEADNILVHAEIAPRIPVRTSLIVVVKVVEHLGTWLLPEINDLACIHGGRVAGVRAWKQLQREPPL
jgi:hypothetical protein